MIPYGEALKEAKATGGDLIMVARNARPPVLKLGDAQKALFAQRQQEKEMRRRQLEARRAGSVKEVPATHMPLGLNCKSKGISCMHISMSA